MDNRDSVYVGQWSSVMTIQTLCSEVKVMGGQLRQWRIMKIEDIGCWTAKTREERIIWDSFQFRSKHYLV